MKRLRLETVGGRVEELRVRSATIEAGGVLLVHEVTDEGDRVRMLAADYWVEAVAEEVKP